MTMSVKIRPYTKRGKRGWEVDIVVQLPNGQVIRERKKSRLTSKSGTKAWATQRELALIRGETTENEPEIPTFGEFFPRYLEGQAIANREKPSSVLAKKAVWKNYVESRFSKLRLDELGAEHVQRF